jgi:acyl-CoA synthetase (AMP-forming)/AMP-acid ligase II
VNVWQFLERASDLASGGSFIDAHDAQLSYADVIDQSERMAGGLEAAGVRRGDHVAVAMPSGVELLVVFFALMRLGCVYVPIISGSRPDEVEYVVGHSEARALIVSEAELEHLDLTTVELSGVARLLFLGDSPPPRFNPLKPGTPDGPPAPMDPREPMAIMYTSGSTGRPKGVVLPHSSFAKAGFLKADRLDYSPEDVVLCVLPLYHVGGLHYCLAPAMARGCKIMFQSRFSVSRFWDDVARAGATGGLLMPAMMSMLMTRPATAGDRSNTLEFVCSHFVDPRFRERYDVDIVTTWSLSESAGIATYSKRSYSHHAPKLIGWAVGDVDVRVMETAGEHLVEAPRGAIGELAVRHDAMMTEYWRDPVSTGKAMRDGWLLSGDLGRMDDHGRLFFEGRVKNMIKRSGENISAEEVEERILDHPAVFECAVVGVRDPIRTEEAKAYVTCRDGAEVAPDELAAWCAEVLSDFKVPRFIQFIDAMPRNATDKIARPALAEIAGRTWDREAGRWLETGVVAHQG